MLIVGGGITGVGALLDATSRGLRAALVERDDLAVGTSSRSSKLIHGGLRYLEQFRFGLVREALAERATLIRIAGHLVRLEPFVGAHPRVAAAGALHGRGPGPLWAAGCRLPAVPDALARPGGRSRRCARSGCVAHFIYRDGVEDDARLVVAVCRTAMSRGAVVATRVRATGLVQQGGRVTGVQADRPRRAARDLTIQADSVVDATGATGGPGGPFSADAGAVRRDAQPGHPPGRRPGAHPGERRTDHPDPGTGAVPHPVGPALDHRHHRPPL